CGVDFLAADGHKWMLGPEGAGIMYVRKELLDMLRPLLIGWNSVETAGDYGNPDLRLKSNAGRYEGGSYNMAGIAGLAASLELLTAYTPRRVEIDLLAVTDELCERLRTIGAEVASDRRDSHKSGIVAFTQRDVPTTVARKHLLDAGVVVRERSGRLRASPHAYTNSDDIDRLIDRLKSVKSL
ncbi:MAG: aminotransferase class V-fold PLP-dependent enzyme, partial [Planctomycetota bacterium]|nr:aminotransferase class V-fold PLP-dependent enzyme [Planctomycetota bacterium]